jgi:TPR repeat protein
MPAISVTALERPDAAQLRRLLERDPAAAVERLRAYAEQGEPQLQLLLGQLLINGVGAVRDPQAALRWFRAAARAQVPMAMNMVGRCHEYGLGTPVDYAQAARWYHRAATFECDWAIYNYAHMLANGRGVQQDRAAAFLWFKLAAAHGHARAMAFLGQYYENGWGTPPDRETAFSLYRRSAVGGDYRGQCSYASMLAEHGYVEAALCWLRRAVSTAPPHFLTHLACVLRGAAQEALRAFAHTLPAPAQRRSTPACEPGS